MNKYTFEANIFEATDIHEAHMLLINLEPKTAHMQRVYITEIAAYDDVNTYCIIRYVSYNKVKYDTVKYIQCSHI